MGKKSRKEICYSGFKIIIDILGILGFFVSLYNIWATRIIDRREIVIVNNVYADQWTDAEDKKEKKLKIVISNNSYVDVSITDIRVNYDGHKYVFASNNCSDLPLNLEANNTGVCEISITITLSDWKKLYELAGMRLLFNDYSENELEIVTSKNFIINFKWYDLSCIERLEEMRGEREATIRRKEEFIHQSEVIE